MLDKVIEIYKEIRPLIEERLKDFENVWKEATEEELFAELCFCLLTPQSKAVVCDKAIKSLKEKNLILTGSEEEIQNELVGVRFKRNKSKYIILARQLFLKNGGVDVRSKIKTDDVFYTREWLVNNIKGFGYKEASHFLRNIGFGSNISILDRHILKNLKLLEVIEEIPKTLTKKRYLNIESSMRDFCEETGIPMDHLDLVLWYKEAGKVFK
jgi:N-glycosylase/DNA lyase